MGKAKTPTTEPGTDLAPRGGVLERLRQKGDTANQALAELDEMSFDQLLTTLRAEGMTDASDLGEGWHLVTGDDGKSKFVGVPFIIIDYRINEKWNYGPGVSLEVKTAVPVVFEGKPYTRFIINDGSTGISRQVQNEDAKNKGVHKPILVRKGLTRSEYEVTVMNKETGKKEPIVDPATGKNLRGVTFYLDTSL